MTGIGLQPGAGEQRLPCGGFDGRSRTLAADVDSDRSGLVVPEMRGINDQPPDRPGKT